MNAVDANVDANVLLTGIYVYIGIDSVHRSSDV
jgi:hypothetical protein